MGEELRARAIVKLRRIFQPDVLFAYAAYPATILAVYFLSLSQVLPEGINQVFVTRSGLYVLPVAIVLQLAVFLGAFISGERKLYFERPAGKLALIDLTVLLLPLVPVIQYILINRDILSPLGSLLVLLFFAAAGALFTLVLPIVLGVISSKPILTSVGLALTFSITGMAILSGHYAWHQYGSLKVQLPIFGAVFLVSFLFLHLGQKRGLALFILILFLSNSAVLAITHWEIDAESEPPQANSLAELVHGRDPNVTPNIYLLVYDGYVSNETMLGYGIDNSHQERFLVDQGFTLYPHTYSIARTSVDTMSRVLNASISMYGNQRGGVSGNGIVHQLLGGYGYENIGVFTSPDFFLGTPAMYDYFFPGYTAFSSAEVLIESILIGEFRFDVTADSATLEQFVSEKRNLFLSVPANPRFMYAHSSLPSHSQNSGRCLPNETELYQERLVRANEQMRQDVETVLQHDPTAILAIAGDHGPYLTKNCTTTTGAYPTHEISRLDIQDRFGTFLAIRWPSDEYEQYDEITVLQDLFAAIFAFMFRDDSILEAKVEPVTVQVAGVNNIAVEDGLIRGGMDDGKQLFIQNVGNE